MRLFNSGKVKYNPVGLVLDVPSGFAPTPEADVCVDLDPKRVKITSNLGYISLKADALHLPFKNQVFDYVSCMHLAEHLEHHQIKKLFSELIRVAPRGYIEVPSIFSELLHNCDKAFLSKDDYHKQLCFFSTNTLHLIRKADTWSTEHRILRELFRKVMSKQITQNNIELFFIGFEWNKTIEFKTYDSLSNIPKSLLDDMLSSINSYALKVDNESKLNRVLTKVHRISRDQFLKYRRPKKKYLRKINIHSILR